MEFAIGFACGMGLAAMLCWAAARTEWAARRKIERRLEYLEGKLCCGRGVFGCTGGPNCNWSHK